MKTALTAILLVLSANVGAVPFLDRSIDFSIDTPKDTKVEKNTTSQGSIVSMKFRDDKNYEAVTLQAMRITNGGSFDMPILSVFTEFIGGMSDRIGTSPIKPIRTITYLGMTLYVATHLGVNTGSGSPQGITTVAYFAEKGTWRKMMLLQFMSDANAAPSDAELLNRFASLKYEPSLSR
ncbi:hypothetical protein [Massilia genomosp. 1]|uniref:Uncharacterized protein n=1 Tax=Massilia genomosp. 1 TaxID=2609280 RepID=A0ABX0MZ63_9BURK|nr:hypothetical protein [Massilia genomosp. 1]NHZ66025.1 hypothetical protein [Massilia genomosp. 1]